jgi:hypothetical protein
MKSIFVKQFIISGVIFILTFFYLTQRYYIAFDQQDKPCLLTTVFLVDTWAKAEDFSQGDLMAYEYHLEGTLIPKGTILVKQVAATPNQTITFNGERVSSSARTFHADITSELARLGVHMPASVDVKTNENEFFLVGETAYSYDSRYWGSAIQSNIVGKAYAIL